MRRSIPEELADLMDELYSGSLEEQAETLLLLGGERLCTEAKHHLAQAGGGISGSIMTPRRLVEEMYDMMGGDLPVADLSSREIIITEIMEGLELSELKVGGRVRQGMVSHISREIGDMISGGISPEDIGGDEGRRKDLSAVLDGYLRMLESKQLIDSAQVPWRVVEMVGENGELPWKRMAVYLLPELPPSMTTLLDMLCERLELLKRMEISGYQGKTNTFSIPPRGERGRQTLRSEGKFGFIRGSTPFDEVDRIARYLKSRILEGGEIEGCAVVFPYRKRYDPHVKLLFERYGIPLDMGNDLRLDSTPMGSTFLKMLDLPLKAYPRNDLIDILSAGLLKMRGLDWRQLERITRKAFILGGGKDPVAGWIDDLISFNKDPEMADSEREASLPWAEFLTELLYKLENMSSGKKTARKITEEIMDLISIHFREPADEDDTFEIILRSIKEVRRRASMLGQGKLTYGRYMEILRLEMNKAKITTGAAEGGVKVLGLAGAAGMRFDICIVGGCTSGQLPAASHGFRIIPEGERISAGIRQVTERREMLEQLAVVAHHSDELVISTHSEEGGRPVLVSPFVEDLNLVEIDRTCGLFSVVDVCKRIGELRDPALDLYDRRDEFHSLMHDEERLMSMLSKDRIQWIERGLLGRKMRCSAGPSDHRGTIQDEASISMLRTRFGPEHVWSSSRLEMYRECPYSFFARYVIGLKEREDLEPGVPPEKKGLIFHSIADRFYSTWMDLGRYGVNPAELDQAWKVMREAADLELASHPYSGPYWDALKDQLLGSCGEEGLLLEFLKVESGYRGKFKVHGTEVKFGPLADTDPVEISLPGGEGSFLLQGSIDRVDMMRTEKGDLFYIWDYKTGSRDIPKESLQVPLYLAALRKMEPSVMPGGGGYYYIRRKGSVRRDPAVGEVCWEGNDMERISGEVKAVSSRITNDIEVSLEIIDSIGCGVFEPDPSCRSRYCPFVDICRRREVQ